MKNRKNDKGKMYVQVSVDRGKLFVSYRTDFDKPALSIIFINYTILLFSFSVLRVLQLSFFATHFYWLCIDSYFLCVRGSGMSK